LVPAPRQDCAFSSWKRTVGVDIEVPVNDLKTAKAKLGITDAEVRDFDALLKDYAIKYDTACQDFRAGRMSLGEYTCRRQNMDRVLDAIRSFVQAIEAAKGIADASAQKAIILGALDALRVASKANYRTGCASAMNVSPKKLTFSDSIPERSIQVSNFGNNEFSFSVVGLPESFSPKPDTGTLQRAATASVSIIRTLIPPPTNQPVRFHVRTSLLDDEEVEIVLDARNAALYDTWGKDVRSLSLAENREPTVEDAVKVVEHSLPAEITATNRDALRYFFAAGVLTQIGKNAEARQALDTAMAKDPSLERQSATLMLRGVVLYREGHSDGALRAFAAAKQFAGPEDTETKPVADLFSGAVLLSRGDGNAAAQHLSDGSVLKHVERNPDLLTFTERVFKTPNLAATVRRVPVETRPSPAAGSAARQNDSSQAHPPPLPPKPTPQPRP